MRSFKALGALLTYPDESLLGAVDEIAACLDGEVLLPASVRLMPLLERLRSVEPMALQEEYVALFDRNRALSLHLYEHVHGDSRDRGQAMVRLATVYRLHGFEIAVPELPDYLPLFCEFLSFLPEKAARSLLAEAADMLETLRCRLERRASPYAAVFGALLALAPKQADPEVVRALLAGDSGDLEDFEAMDRAWVEEPVNFAPEPTAQSAGCGAGRA